MHASLRTKLGTAAAVVWLALVALGAPAGALAPQPIDASEQGPLAFVAMTVMCVLFVASLFYMDRVRQRREQRAEQRRPTE
jgi:hypothetical protein